MSVRNIPAFFEPKGVALIGASTTERSVGNVVARNLLAGGYLGQIHLVNPRAQSLYGHAVVPSIAAIEGSPELAIVAIPPLQLPDVVAELGAKGTKAAIVLTAGFGEMGAEGKALQLRMLEAARPYTMRIVGPNCLGVLAPAKGVNGSFAHRMPVLGHTAFVTQSGAMLTAVLDWADGRGIGFSHLVSLGGMADVDFGDMLDYLATDPQAHSVLLYIESIKSARKFMSAARRCARVKPVVVVKSGRHAEGARAAASHTGALAGSDAVYDAAFRRAGLLRVLTIEDLFDALEVVARAPRLTGDRIAILTNGGGAGVLATDHLIDRGGKLAELSKPTLGALDKALPVSWSHGNPIDIIGDADPARYAASMEALIADPNVDAILAINCPVAVADSAGAAEAVINSVAQARTRGVPKPVFASWLGNSAVAEARKRFIAADLPHYETPEHAVTAMMRLVHHSRAQALLLEAPPSLDIGERDLAKPRAAIARALNAGREWLEPAEVNDVLSTFGVPIVPVRQVATPADAAKAAAELGFPAAVKILSRDIVHKSDVGGVALNLGDVDDVRHAAESMLKRVAKLLPAAKVEGFVVQPMARRRDAHELIVGLAEDTLFGPVILFGQGGTSVEVVNDKALALPPLNSVLARDLIDRTRVARLLSGYRDRPAAAMSEIIRVLLALQDIATELPEVKELDINPLWADEKGVLALDARIRIAKSAEKGTDRFAIKPYPAELIHEIADAHGHPFILRPIRPEDAELLQDMGARSRPEDIRMRFFSHMTRLPEWLAKRLSQLDFDREMAFLAIDKENPGDGCSGVVRLALDPNRDRGEYAIIVRSDRIGTGLGLRLMKELIAYARGLGVRQIFGDVLVENSRMLAMCERLGFYRAPQGPQPDIVEVRLDL